MKFLADRCSGQRSPGRSSTNRNSCWRMSRQEISIPNHRRMSWSCSRSSMNRSTRQSFWSRMIRPRQVIATGCFLSAMVNCIPKSIKATTATYSSKKSSTRFHSWGAMAMTFRQFVFHNVFRNVRLYAAYFLSSLFTVSVFFTFAIFAFHPELAGPGMNSHVLKGMAVAGGIIYVFSFFYVLYSMNAFLRSRKKEFGVLLIHGMTSYQIRWMVFWENMIIGFAATGIGILLGLIFAKAVLL